MIWVYQQSRFQLLRVCLIVGVLCRGLNCKYTFFPRSLSPSLFHHHVNFSCHWSRMMWGIVSGEHARLNMLLNQSDVVPASLWVHVRVCMPNTDTFWPLNPGLSKHLFSTACWQLPHTATNELTLRWHYTAAERGCITLYNCVVVILARPVCCSIDLSDYLHVFTQLKFTFVWLATRSSSLLSYHETSSFLSQYSHFDLNHFRL